MLTRHLKPFLAATLLFLSPAFCQEDNEKTYHGYTHDELVERSSDLMEFLNDILVVSIATPEMSLKQFVQVLQEQSPIHLNVIVLDDAMDIRIPPMALTNVTAGAVINALRIATNELVTFDYDETGQVGFFGRSENYARSSEVTVVNLKSVLNRFSNESFLSAIEIGIKMMGSDNSNLQMKLHEETSTLFLKGANNEINLVMQVVDQMSKPEAEDHTGQLFGVGGNSGNLLEELLGGKAVGGILGGNGHRVEGDNFRDMGGSSRFEGRGILGGGGGVEERAPNGSSRGKND